MSRLRRTACGAGALVLAFAATAAAGPSLPPPLVEVVRPTPEATIIRASVDIDAPPAVVWRVINDCAYARQLMRKLQSCKVLQRDAAGRWDIREHVIKPALLPAVRTVVRSEYHPPRAIHFKQVEGDVRAQSGRWSLDPLPGGGTRAVYEVQVVLGIPIAEPVFRAAIRAEAPKGLENLRRVSMEQAAAVAGGA